MNRRHFLSASLATAAAGQTKYEWGGPVLDIHLHPRRNAHSAEEHLEGGTRECGDPLWRGLAIAIHEHGEPGNDLVPAPRRFANIR